MAMCFSFFFSDSRMEAIEGRSSDNTMTAAKSPVPRSFVRDRSADTQRIGAGLGYLLPGTGGARQGERSGCGKEPSPLKLWSPPLPPSGRNRRIWMEQSRLRTFPFPFRPSLSFFARPAPRHLKEGYTRRRSPRTGSEEGNSVLRYV